MILNWRRATTQSNSGRKLAQSFVQNKFFYLHGDYILILNKRSDGVSCHSVTLKDQCKKYSASTNSITVLEHNELSA